MYNYDLGGGIRYDSEEYRKKILKIDGGPGSGNWGHAGVEGQLGGSAPGDESGNSKQKESTEDRKINKFNNDLAKKTRDKLLKRKRNPYRHHEPAETEWISFEDYAGSTNDFLKACKNNGLFPVHWTGNGVIVTTKEEAEKARSMFPRSRWKEIAEQM